MGITQSFAQSQTDEPRINPELLKALEYRSIGPYRGGRVTAVAGTSSKPFTFYMGSTGGGVWKTEDAGERWTNISDGFFEAGSIGSITVANSDPNVIYVGTGSDAPRGNISAGVGMYKSTDAGKTWKHVGLRNGGQIGEIQIHPENPELVYAAVLGNIFGPNSERGVYRSKNGGKNWEQVLSLSDSTGAIDVEMDPTNPRILYAGFWRAERKPWTLIDGSTEGGVFKSVDGGDSWERVHGGLPDEGILGKVDIAISPANPDRIWVMQQAKAEEKGGLYRSDDGGKNWKRVNREHKLRQRQYYYTHLFADPIDEHTVYVLNTGFYKSTNAGETFERISVPHGDVHSLWLNPDDPDIMVNSNDGGANVSLNGGKTWTTQKNQPTAEFYRVEVDNRFPYRVYGAQQDNSTISVPGKPQGDISSEQYWYSVGGGESGHIAVHPENPDLVYAGTYSGEITRFDHTIGQTLQMTPYPHYTEGTKMTDLKYRFQWNFPIEISRHNPDVIYITSQYVHRSTDGGFTWEVISPDLTTNDPKYLDLIPGGPVQHDATGVEVYCSLFSFAESTHDGDELWTGSDDGLIHLSRDGGETWQDITPKNMPQAGTVNAIELSMHNPGTAYVAVYRYRRADFRPYVFKTDNYGKSWNLITNGKNGIPANHFVRVVREDPDRQGLLYAGTEFGMYFSMDDGEHWQSFQQNLPVTPITDLKVHEKDLVVSTQGRSFWILDDLSPLHEMEINAEDNGHKLFVPRDAYRTQLSGSGDSPGPDPYPTGALIYAVLADDYKSETVSLEILDESGQPVRTYSTETKEDEKAETLKVKAGLNRFEWDLTYTGPFTVPDLVTMVMRNPARGPEAVPGTYRVRLNVGDWSETRSFELHADPRWSATTEELRQTFELATDIADKISSFQHTIEELRSAQNQIQSIAGDIQNRDYAGEVQEQANSLADKLKALEEEFINDEIESGQDPIGMERRLSNRMGRLYQVVRGHDAQPTGGMMERHADLVEVYEHLMNRYRTLVSEDVKSFNELLNKHGVLHVRIPQNK
ncbi:VPS10 domain-containing protein [Halalkalibaculum roseum]|uniref:VPS10 domain-containing protein n=1 Tax=Halalkalibaculum roseum TaxID=2709311 RepID=UPI0020121EA2|nr:glycosyl hydrolase [Halalkalibaculum roseum]